jgi:hypothetical protein
MGAHERPSCNAVIGGDRSSYPPNFGSYFGSSTRPKPGSLLNERMVNSVRAFCADNKTLTTIFLNFPIDGRFERAEPEGLPHCDKAIV